MNTFDRNDDSLFDLLHMKSDCRKRYQRRVKARQVHQEKFPRNWNPAEVETPDLSDEVLEMESALLAEFGRGALTL